MQESLEQLAGLRAQAAALPLHPGVYLFKNAEGDVLYVGKANVLRERVRSYFAKDVGITRNPGIEQMMVLATTLEHQLAGSEPEALLLEARLIRRHKPRYNIALRDDKSFLLIKIDYNFEFPVVGMAREKDLELLLEKKRRPVPSSNAIRQKVDKVEFYGPFPSAYSVRSVLKTVRGIWPFRDCSTQKFNQFAAIGHGCIFANLHVCNSPCVRKVTPEDYLENIQQLRKFLRGEHATLVQEVEDQMNIAAESEQFELATILRNRLFGLKRFQYVVDTFKTSRREVDAGGPTYNPEEDIRLECYDISNNQGAHAVGSMVCAIVKGGKISPITTSEDVKKAFVWEKARYRKFRIQTVAGISDTEMLQEVLRRRFKRASQWSLPDMVVIDGGKGQLNAVAAVQRERDLIGKLYVASVAKGPTRKRTDLYGEGWNEFSQISIERWHQISELMREEAHRFAISYYRNLHRKAVLGR
jgi:excinuclease ABC subunit C